MAPPVDDPTPAAVFARAVEAVRSAVLRPELVLTEIPEPADLAPFAIAFSADVMPTRHGLDSLLGTGRFVLLYDPAEPEQWRSAFRVVCYAQAPLETDIGVDPFLADVTWSWLVDALETRGAPYAVPSGTATKMLSTGFGALTEHGDSAQIELRASWSPLSPDGSGVGAHLEAWGELLCLLAGLPPSADVVGLLPHHRSARG